MPLTFPSDTRFAASNRVMTHGTARLARRTVPNRKVGRMNSAYFPALAALAGSAVGALASFATTWITQHAQERNSIQAQSFARRERLYGEFIDEASSVFADALLHQLTESTRMVRLYAIRSKLRLFAPTAVTKAADEAVKRIIDTYMAPDMMPIDLSRVDMARLDFLQSFTEFCRDDLLA